MRGSTLHAQAFPNRRSEVRHAYLRPHIGYRPLEDLHLRGGSGPIRYWGVQASSFLEPGQQIHAPDKLRDQQRPSQLPVQLEFREYGRGSQKVNYFNLQEIVGRRSWCEPTQITYQRPLDQNHHHRISHSVCLSHQCAPWQLRQWHVLWNPWLRYHARP